MAYLIPTRNSPRFALDFLGYTREERELDFSMYFEFRPSIHDHNSISVAIAVIPWSMSYDVQWNSTLFEWQLLDSNSTPNPAAQLFPGLPKWNGNITEPKNFVPEQ